VCEKHKTVISNYNTNYSVNSVHPILQYMSQNIPEKTAAWCKPSVPLSRASVCYIEKAHL